MEFKYLFVKEEVQIHRLSFEHIRTDMMVANPLTKGLSPNVFISHLEHMCVINKVLVIMIEVYLLWLRHYEFKLCFYYKYVIIKVGVYMYG